MTKHPFEVGGRYKNEHGDYEVLGIEGEQMLVRYDDRKQQLVTVAIQARIWQRYQDESAPPPARKPIPNGESLDTQPVCDLVQFVLDSKFSAPYPEDITDRVCQEIENDPDWLSEYHSLVDHFGSKGKNGRLTVNSSIGWFTKDLTGMRTIGVSKAEKSSLIKSYSRLGYEIGKSKGIFIAFRLERVADGSCLVCAPSPVTRSALDAPGQVHLNRLLSYGVIIAQRLRVWYLLALIYLTRIALPA